MAYKKGIPITGGFYPIDNGDFPLVEAADVFVDDDSRLSDKLSEVADLKSALKSGKKEDAIWHLGFYIDEDGDLCQVDEEETDNG